MIPWDFEDGILQQAFKSCILKSLVRGNWQKRVEQAENRRKEAKAKKVIRSSKSVNKSLVQNHLWPLLNEISIPISKLYDDDDPPPTVQESNSYETSEEKDDFMIHFWLDIPPSSVKDTYLLEDKEHEDTQFKSPKNVKKSSKRAYDSKQKHSGKKLHPRSHENHISSPEVGGGGKRKNSIDEYSGGGEGENALLLNKSHFFHGECKFNNYKSNSKSSKKTPSIKHENQLYKYNRKLKQKSLYDILIDKKSSIDVQETNRKVLEETAKAASSAYFHSAGISEDDKSHDNAMHMLYYLELNLCKQMKNSLEHRKDEQNALQTLDIIAASFTSELCPIGACVYACYKKTLLFDRYRGGIVIDKDEHQHLFHDDELKQSSSDMSKNENGSNTIMHCTDLNQLPVTVLEHILAFANDEASGVFPMVCMNWYQEIGKTSPALWLTLLQRRQWPCPKLASSDKNDQGDKEIIDSYAMIEDSRKMFLGHKNITRAIDVLFDGIEYLESNISEPPSRHTLATNKIKDTKDNNFICSGLFNWDDTTMILAHQKECILSLFKAERNDDTNITLSCKQVLSIRVAPFPHSRKTSCDLMSFALDKNSILCCYEVNESKNWLVLLKREDLLLNSAESVLDRDAFQRFELTELLEKSCFTLGELVCITELLETMEISVEDIKVSIHGDIVSCGDGHFIFLIDIFIIDDGDEGHDENPSFVARAIVQFSTKRKCLTWAVLIPPQMAPAATSTTLSNYDSTSRTIVCNSLAPGPIISLMFEKGGKVISAFHEEINPHSEEMWHPEELEDTNKKLIAVSCTHVIYADHLRQEAEEQKKIELSFLSLNKIQNETLVSNLTVRNIDILYALHVQGNYCIIACGREQNLNDEDEFDGHWFGDESEDNQTGSCIIIIHIPSRIEIFRRWSKIFSFTDVTLTLCDDSCVSGVTSSGSVVMSGHILRDIQHSIEKASKCTTKMKTKKKKKAVKNNKKDGFARGMSLRG